jgi:nucleoside-diphosphate-sugar epimerase
MFKDAMSKHEINVNNASIWRPILNIEDAVAAYTRSIEASEKISGIFNVASGNYTVGEVADFVTEAVEKEFNIKVDLKIQNKPDFRNYKVSVEKAVNVLSFKPRHDVDTTLRQLIANLDKFKDWQNPKYYNILMFKNIQLAVHFGSH